MSTVFPWFKPTDTDQPPAPCPLPRERGDAVPRTDAQRALLTLDPVVCAWDPAMPLRVSDVVRETGWVQAARRHPELARLLAAVEH